MRRSELFWGSLLVLLGVLFFLRTAGVLTGDVFGWFWPFCIIALGLWVLFSRFTSHMDFNKAEQFSIPLQVPGKPGFPSIMAQDTLNCRRVRMPVIS